MRTDIAKIMLGFLPKSNPTRAQIKEAYRKKAFKVHPDRAPIEKKCFSESKFKLISECYEHLQSGSKDDSNEEQKQRQEAASRAAAYEEHKQQQKAWQHAEQQQWKGQEEASRASSEEHQRQEEAGNRAEKKKSREKSSRKVYGWIFLIGAFFIVQAFGEEGLDEETRKKSEEEERAKAEALEMLKKTHARVECPYCLRSFTYK